jgi:hypothetical protein
MHDERNVSLGNDVFAWEEDAVFCNRPWLGFLGVESRRDKFVQLSSSQLCVGLGDDPAGGSDRHKIVRSRCTSVHAGERLMRMRVSNKRKKSCRPQELACSYPRC